MLSPFRTARRAPTARRAAERGVGPDPAERAERGGRPPPERAVRGVPAVAAARHGRPGVGLGRAESAAANIAPAAAAAPERRGGGGSASSPAAAAETERACAFEVLGERNCNARCTTAAALPRTRGGRGFRLGGGAAPSAGVAAPAR